MPDWGWVISIFAGASLAYWAGVALGRADKAPSENAWINVRRYSVDANKEIALHNIDMEHDEQIRMIERGVFDQIDFSEDDENDPD